jgi:hypothetical protein
MLPMYREKKKKREVDPLAPPRPTLLGHEKEMKMFRQQYKEIADKNVQQALIINSLERKVNRLQSQVDAMTSVINRRNK